MSSTKVVVFGVQPFASWVASRFLEHSSMDIVGVVSEDSRRDFSHHQLDLPPLYRFARESGIPILSEDEVHRLGESEHDRFLGFTARWGHILPESVLQVFSEGVVNAHGGYLPRWRGSDIPSHLILEAADFGGATLHILDNGIDTGDIIDRLRFRIPPEATAYSIFLQIQHSLMVLVNRFLADPKGALQRRVPQSQLADELLAARTYRRRDSDRYRALDPGLVPTTDLGRIARAFTFPGREPARLDFGTTLVELTAAPRDRAHERKD